MIQLILKNSRNLFVQGDLFDLGPNEEFSLALFVCCFVVVVFFFFGCFLVFWFVFNSDIG